TGVRLGMREIAATGLTMFGQLPRSADSPLLAAACKALLESGRPAEAIPLCRRAADLQPDSADRAMNLGIAMARGGDAFGAERSLLRAIELDPSLKHAYVQLWTLYDKQGKRAQMTETMTRFLNWNPQNIMFRVLKTP